jgi:hypothetical protein
MSIETSCQNVLEKPKRLKDYKFLYDNKSKINPI